jgi:hypothetical protein
MITTPKIGKIIYLMATIPIITKSGTFEPFKPENIDSDNYSMLSTMQLVREGKPVGIQNRTVTLTLQKICSQNQSNDWNGCLPANMKEC